MTFANTRQNQPGHKKKVARKKKAAKKAPKKAAKKKKGAEKEPKQTFIKGTEPLVIPAIEKAGQALRKNGEARKQINLEKKQLKQKLTKAMEANVKDLPKRTEAGEEISFYNLGKGFEAKLKPGQREAVIGKAKKMPDEA